MMSFLHVVIVIVFGLIFIPSIIREGAPIDLTYWWYTTVWALFAIGFGGWFTIFTRQFIERCKRQFEFFYRKTRFFVFRLQAEGMSKSYMYPFARALGILFFIIGVVMLVQNLNAIPFK